MFPRGIYTTAEPSFNALFRLLEDAESHNNGNGHAQHRRRHVQTFNPRFDVYETEGTYELHGDLAGVEKDNVQLEFTDPQTMVIRGRIDRKYEAGTPPAATTPAAVPAEDVQMSGALPEKTAEKEAEAEGEWQDVEPTASKEHQASVEDENDERDTATEAAAPTPATTTAEVAKRAPTATAPASAPRHCRKYWVSERAVGEFNRSFSFPNRIEQDFVTANLKDGILTVSVPKAKKYESRRITVN